MMDPNTKQFEMLADDKEMKEKVEELNKALAGQPELNPGGPREGKDYIFRIGQEIEIQGHKFELRKITKKDLVIRPINRAGHKELFENGG